MSRNVPSLTLHVLCVGIVISLQNDNVVVVRIDDEFPRRVFKRYIGLIKHCSQFFQSQDPQRVR